MPKNEDGEFELILGNKQLLSMFFVVVVLLGVFFVMGYIVGRNSAPLIASETSRKPEGKPLVVESPAPKPAAPSETPSATASTAAAPASSTAPAAAAPAPAAEKPPEKAPQASPPAQTAAATPPKSEPAPKRETKAAEKAEKTEQAKAKAKAASAPSNPAVGATYLQLSATDKADADKMVEVLRKSNFVALAAEVPEKPGLYRVLVGPIPSGELNKTKADLQAKGFPGNAAIRKTF